MGLSTAWCSTAVVIACLPRFAIRSAPEKIAQLSASVPQEVKNTRSGCAPSAAATLCRDLCSSRAAEMPSR